MDVGLCSSDALVMLHSILTIAGVKWTSFFFYSSSETLLVTSQGHCGFNYLPLYVLGNTTNYLKLLDNIWGGPKRNNYRTGQNSFRCFIKQSQDGISEEAQICTKHAFGNTDCTYSTQHGIAIIYS